MVICVLNPIDSQPGKMIQRTDKLRGFEDANDMPGTLHWEIGYLYVLLIVPAPVLAD